MPDTFLSLTYSIISYSSSIISLIHAHKEYNYYKCLPLNIYYTNW